MCKSYYVYHFRRVYIIQQIQFFEFLIGLNKRYII